MSLLHTRPNHSPHPPHPPLRRPPPAASSASTVYQSNALVGREVTVPQGAGNIELVVPALPASTVQNSLYAESGPEIRVLSTRYRSRPLAQTAQEEVRALEAKLLELRNSQQTLQKTIEASTANLTFIGKLEDFTKATMTQVAEKGLLSAEQVTKLAQFVMDTRNSYMTGIVATQQQIQASQQQQEFLSREAARVSSSSDKTSREAIIVVDKADAAPGKVTLYYMVSAASWTPQYKVHATPGDKKVDIEYLAAIRQQTGEDWSNVDVVLSTAMPMFNAAPPELSMLEVQPNLPNAGQPTSLNLDNQLQLQKGRSNGRQQLEFQQNAAQMAYKGELEGSNRYYNLAAAVTMADELMNDKEELKQLRRDSSATLEGQSVTFHLNRRLTIPWRDDAQLIEVARLGLEAEYIYKAVPVLTPHVYRLATLTNTSQTVLLPGEAVMYMGPDFVGRASLPLVAVGQEFTAGFGVDPQIQVKRELVDKTRTIQGGNQVQKFDYRLTISNYKTEPVTLQLWDRIPHAEGEAINIALGSPKPALSTDETYVRDQQNKGMLRWDIQLPPNTSGAKATTVTYDFKLEHARDASIGNIFNR